jgi:hypothetical protein
MSKGGITSPGLPKNSSQEPKMKRQSDRTVPQQKLSGSAGLTDP